MEKMHHLHLPQPSHYHPSSTPIPSKFLHLPKLSLIFPHKPITSKTTHSLKLRLHHTTKRVQHTTLQSPQTKLWNTKIKHHLEKGDYKVSISLYNQMLDQQITPNSTTFVHVLKACSLLTDLKTLRLIHNDILRFQLDSNNFATTALFNGYLKCGATDLAHQVFEKMPQRDVVSWTMIIRQNYQEGQFDMAIQTFRRMIWEGVLPDEFALVGILSVITDSRCLKHGLEVHGYLIRKGFEFNEIMIGSLVNMYTKLEKTEFSNRIVYGTTERSAVVSTILIKGLIDAGDAIGAIDMFVDMVNSGVEPSEKTISCILCAISQLGFLQTGIQIHGYVIKRQFDSDAFVTSGLIDLYTKCASDTSSCKQLFDKLYFKDLVSWTGMISSLGRLREGPAALRVFDEMQSAGFHPDSVTFTAVLSACRSSGMLDEGLRCFNSMIRDHNIRPREEHYASLMDLIAKDGRLEEAYGILESMDLRSDGGVWEAFLCACRVHGNVGLGEICARKLVEIEPDNSSGYILLSDIYSAVGRWEDADNLRKVMKQNRLRREEKLMI
ncbi:pentatricopeptide repeat-containing protein At5g39350-like [Tasmannia lanceolata]|uniref:pentatricopeptide repeat-containing protein At5g39350-like n=1 Tax=Tasmannia lanceolata TaxID=3420 RepID=UPI004063F376